MTDRMLLFSFPICMHRFPLQAPLQTSKLAESYNIITGSTDIQERTPDNSPPIFSLFSFLFSLFSFLFSLFSFLRAISHSWVSTFNIQTNSGDSGYFTSDLSNCQSSIEGVNNLYKLPDLAHRMGLRRLQHHSGNRTKHCRPGGLCAGGGRNGLQLELCRTLRLLRSSMERCPADK